MVHRATSAGEIRAGAWHGYEADIGFRHLLEVRGGAPGNLPALGLPYGLGLAPKGVGSELRRSLRLVLIGRINHAEDRLAPVLDT
jgi:hypothetical protein